MQITIYYVKVEVVLIFALQIQKNESRYVYMWFKFRRLYISYINEELIELFPKEVQYIQQVLDTNLLKQIIKTTKKIIGLVVLTPNPNQLGLVQKNKNHDIERSMVCD
jgi:hypothetical protein